MADEDAPGPSGSGADGAAALRQIEARLAAPDAVMEPDILKDIVAYVSSGGLPQTAVKQLSDNYHGYAQMASLVCRWLALTSEGNEEGAAAGAPPDEATFLRAFAKDKFDPNAFHSVFSKGPPPWLEGIIRSKPGRQLFYELSSTHKNCLLLNFAIQKMLHYGHEDEVASVGSSLAGYFGVFHRLLVNRLRDVATAADAESLQRLTAELQESCCGAMHTYAHAQAMLAQLGRHPNGARFRRLSQELAERAAKVQGSVVWKMQQCFMEVDASSEAHVQAARLVADVLAAGGGSRAEVSQLCALYSSPEPPPLTLLRQPWLLDQLTASLFTPGLHSMQQQPQLRGSYCQLLALAAAGVDERGAGGALDTADVPPTLAALQAVCSYAHNAAAGMKITAQEQGAAEACLGTPCAAMGLLHCMRCQLTSADFWRDHSSHTSLPSMISMLATIIRRQQLLHGKVMSLVFAILHVMGNSKPELARMLLDVAALALQRGNAAAVLQHVEQWAKAADPSLVRYFVFKLLATTAPPYSQAYAASMIRLMVASGVKRSRTAAVGGPRGGDDSRLAQLEAFAAACNEIEFTPPLSLREKTFLHELQLERVLSELKH